MEHFDPISVVEAAYHLTDDTSAWLDGLRERSSAFFPSDGLVGAMIVDVRDDFEIVELSSEKSDMLEPRAQSVLDREIPFPEELIEIYTTGTSLTSATELLGPDAAEDELLIAALPPGAKDLVGVGAYDPTGFFVQLSSVYPRVVELEKSKAPLWGKLCAHIAAGYRLHRRYEDLHLESADMVMTPDGDLRHLNPKTNHDEWADVLETSVNQIDRARRDLRNERPDDALDLWRGLVRGTYSLVEQIDTDGKRFYVARRNDPEVDTPPTLSKRERQVAAYVGLGHDNRRIAYHLGLSESTIAT